MTGKKHAQKSWSKKNLFLCLLSLVVVTFAGCSVFQPSSQLTTEMNAEEAKGLEDYIDALGSKDWRVRLEAVKALGKTKNPHAAKPLLGALKDSSIDVRVVASNSLLKLDKLAVKYLIAALRSEDSDIRRTAAVNLGKIKDKRAVGPLIEVVRDQSSDVRWEATVALGKIKGARAIEALQEISQNDPKPNIRKAAQQILSQ